MDKQADINDTSLTRLPRVGKPPFKEIATLKTGSLGSWLDVSGMESGIVHKVASERFCLNQPNRYPIDGLDQIKRAGEYFEEHYRKFEPPVRREYAFNLMKRASEVREPMPDLVARYGSETYGEPGQVEMTWASRRGYTPEEKLASLDRLRAAALHTQLDPDSFAAVVYSFDKTAGLVRHYDRVLLDPWHSVLGVKIASFQETIGIDHISEDDVLHMAHMPAGNAYLTRLFSKEVVEKFRKDPIATFKTLTERERQMVGRKGRTLRSEKPGIV
jgi:hypothetical protein